MYELTILFTAGWRFINGGWTTHWKSVVSGHLPPDDGRMNPAKPTADDTPWLPGSPPSIGGKQIVAVLDGAEAIFGFAVSEAIGESLDIIIPETLRRRHWTWYRKTMATGETRYGTGDLLAVRAIHKDGTRISTELTIVMFQDRIDQLLGIAAIMRDVTARFEEMRALKATAARP
jgi:PAS domain S-box-containing protein